MKLKRSKHFRNYIAEKKEKYTKQKRDKAITANIIKRENHDKANRRLFDEEEKEQIVSFKFIEPVPGCIYNMGRANGYIIIPMDQTSINDYLTYIYRYSFHVITQLHNEIGRPLDIQVMSSCNFENIPEEGIDSEIYERAFRLKPVKIVSTNQIQSSVESIRNELDAQLLIPKNVSGLTFQRAVYMRIDYWQNESKSHKSNKRKYIGGKGINFELRNIPVFTKPLRKYEKINYRNNNETQLVFNIKNNDNLCFLYYIVLIKYLTDVMKHEKYERYLIKPRVLPTEIDKIIAFLPLIVFPDDALNEESDKIIRKYFNQSKSSMLPLHLQSLRDDQINIYNLPKGYLNDCKLLVKMLDNIYPMNADDADLIKKYEELNNITINIYKLNNEAYAGKKQLYQTWTSRYMTDTKSKFIDPKNT